MTKWEVTEILLPYSEAVMVVSRKSISEIVQIGYLFHGTPFILERVTGTLWLFHLDYLADTFSNEMIVFVTDDKIHAFK